MKCPHCYDVATHKTVETRKIEGDVYRRRRCNNCSAAFVTVETAPGDMTMPVDPKWTRQARKGQGAIAVPHRPTRPPIPTRLQDVWR